MLCLEGFVIEMHEDAFGEEVQSRGGIGRTVCTSLMTTKPDRSALIKIITWHFKFHLVNVDIFHLKVEYDARKMSCCACYSQILRHLMPLNDGNCRLTIPSIKGRCACDMLPHSFDIGRFKSGKNNSTTIKHIHNESAKLIDSYNVAFDNKDWYNFL